MKLYTGMGPNPRVVNIFAKEKGLEIPSETVDLMAGQNRQEAHLKRNPAGQLPSLELDDGRFISEIIPICEYLEELQPEPSLIGTSAEERATTRMWVRRLDLNIVENLANGFRFSEGMGLFKDRIHTIPQAADDLKAIAQEKLAWLDDLMGDNAFITGKNFTLADMLLFGFLEFGASVGQPLDGNLGWIKAWYERVAARPGVSAG